ncbi:MAG TPA: DUF4321 domain-containing protein [Elusimicrobiales bacterium]|jgi:hypothetical protein|nr:DUF4321 domain-containing protein [Elusimicrobiales bacterium]HOL62660.1 DUF4321 domain-containing protein [Elusimicrobiales bacterium]HPO95234.1 DUF4321 domain-containing protein [Elusimicrobiales bacterium]
MKTVLHILVVIVTGTLFGSVVNKLGSIWFSQTGNVNSILSTAVNTGLNPTTVDLGVIQFTLGLIFKFNIATVLGIFLAAVIYKQIIK